ncbi:cytochrome P450 [Helicosporidium sp. ATCC 50920]|nr:cytochrome P450 [Helicosporidium sp. ATCC 50920]|eukprot:KDD75989.1 cytochrome P450 [Helicosporidium sp. ATCC 50920]
MSSLSQLFSPWAAFSAPDSGLSSTVAVVSLVCLPVAVIVAHRISSKPVLGPWPEGLPRPPQPFWGDSIVQAVLQDDLPDASVKSHTKGGPVYRRTYMGESTTFVSGAANVRSVLNAENNGVISVWPTATYTLLGSKSLAMLHGSEHERLRRMMQVAFTPKAMRGYLPRIEEIMREQMATWASGERLSGWEVANKMMLKVALQVICGFDKEWTRAEVYDDIYHTFATWLKGLFYFKFDWPGTQYRASQLARRRLETMIQRSVDELRKASSAASPPPTGAEEAPVASALEHMLSLESQRGERFDAHELMDNIFMLLFAGHDTTASAVTRILEELRRDGGSGGRVWRALRREQKEVVQEHGEAFTEAALAQCSLAEGVAREAQRLGPVVAMLQRRAERPREVGGFGVAQGGRMVLGLRSTMQQDPLFEDDEPRAFKPERWLRPGALRSPSFVPFGGGPRLCLGNILATHQMKMFVALLVRHYDVEFLSKNERWGWAILPRPMQGFPMRVHAVAWP